MSFFSSDPCSDGEVGEENSHCHVQDDMASAEMFSAEQQLLLNASSHQPAPWEPVSPHQHTYIGIYLIIVGVLGTFDNALVVAMFLRFRVLLTPSNLLLLNLCISDLGICLLGGFPFSGVSSLAGKWLYGDFGCQYYAFMGFLMGIANLTTLFMIALDRYLVTCRHDLLFDNSEGMPLHPHRSRGARIASQTDSVDTDISTSTKKRMELVNENEYTWGGKLTYRRYYQMIAFIWCWSLFWSICPLLGWASYGYEPSVTTCTINWQSNDAGYKWYIMILAVLVYVIPLILTCSCYYQASRFLHRAHETGENVYSYDWATERNVTRMGIFLVLTFLFCWTSYAVVCIWTVFRHPYTVPLILTLLPPLMAKASPVLNPIIYYYSHPRLKKGMMATLTCCFRDPPPELLELPETKSMTEHK